VGSPLVADLKAVRCIHIGLLCIQDDPAQRPTVSTVILMLNSISEQFAEPSEPFRVGWAAPNAPERASSSLSTIMEME
jgi:hypothetical protein